MAKMIEFTVYYKKSKGTNPEARYTDHNLYTAKILAVNEKSATKKFKETYMKPTFVKGFSKTGKKTLTKVKSNIVIIKIFSGDGVRRFTSYAGTRTYKNQRAVRVLKSRQPKWTK